MHDFDGEYFIGIQQQDVAPEEIERLHQTIEGDYDFPVADIYCTLNPEWSYLRVFGPEDLLLWLMLQDPRGTCEIFLPA